MAKRKYTRMGEESVAYQCCNKKCKWEGLESEKKEVRDGEFTTLVCPKCGKESFFGLLEAPEKEPSLYYIQNKNAGFMGNAIMFWRKGSCGHTANIDDSEIFTEEEAAKIVRGNPDKNKAWPVEYIDNNKGIQRIVDSQYIDYEVPEKFLL